MNDEIKELVDDILKGTFNKRIQRRGDKWVVTDNSGNKVLGTHASREQAMEQLRAVEANKQKGVNITLNPVVATPKKNNESKYSSTPTPRDEESRLAVEYVLKGVDIKVNPVETTPKKNNESNYQKDPTPRNEESRLDVRRVASDLVKSILGEEENVDKASNVFSPSPFTNSPKYQDDEEEDKKKEPKEKKKKPKKTACQKFEEIFNGLENVVTDKTITILKEIKPGFNLTLTPTGSGSPIRKESFRLSGEFKVISKSLDKITNPEKDDIVVAGYASTDIRDAQNEKITKEAMKEAFNRWIENKGYANCMIKHKNLQIADGIEGYTVDGKEYKTHFDDIGFFLVSKMRNDDIKGIQDARRDVLNGILKAYSVGGEALDEREVCTAKEGCMDMITKLDLWEVSYCEKGVNSQSDFTVLTAPAA